MSYVIAIEPAQFVTNQISSWLIENLTSVNWGDRHEANRIAVWFLISLGLSTKTLWPGYYQFKDYKQFLRSGHWNLYLTDKCSWYLRCSRWLEYSHGEKEEGSCDSSAWQLTTHWCSCLKQFSFFGTWQMP